MLSTWLSTAVDNFLHRPESPAATKTRKLSPTGLSTKYQQLFYQKDIELSTGNPLKSVDNSQREGGYPQSFTLFHIRMFIDYEG
jgi:hypothetical protein